MAKFRVWYGDDPTYKKVSSLAEAIKFIKKNPDYDESNAGVEEKIDGDWDEWLDDDDQNVHEHLYMYGGKSKFLRVEEDEDDDDDLEEEVEDDEDDDEEAVEEVEDDVVDEDLDDRLMDVIGGGRAVTKDVDDDLEDEDDDLLDDDDDLEDEDDDLEDDEDI